MRTSIARPIATLTFSALSFLVLAAGRSDNDATAAGSRPSPVVRRPPSVVDPPSSAVVANVKVLSNKVKDVSSLEAWKKSYIQPGMADEDKALAIWESVVAHQFQDSPPKEFLHNEDDVYDVMKMFNVYGHSYCGVAACEIASLARYVGLKARVSTIVAHVVPEIEWDGRWHMLDASLVNFFVMKDQPPEAVNGRFSRALTNYAVPKGNIASIAEIIAAVEQWYARNPEYLVQPAGDQGKPHGDDAKLRRLHAPEGWQGWKKGPPCWPTAPSTVGTAGCPPIPTAGTRPCRNTTAAYISRTRPATRWATR